MNNTNDVKIEVIQGDTFTREVEILNLDIETIKDIYITCSDLQLCKKLELKYDIFFFNLTSEETSAFPPNFNGNYDMTIEFNENKFQTIVYKAPFIVYPKNNRIICNG